MNANDYAKQIQGNYEVKSPYHKNKMLPFTITGGIYDKEYPIEVSTVEYKGWTPNYFTTGYTEERIRQMLVAGIIKRKLIN